MEHFLEYFQTLCFLKLWHHRKQLWFCFFPAVGESIFGLKSVEFSLNLFVLLQIEWPWHCERRCKKVPTDLNRNLILLAGDRMVAANCDLAENANTGTAIWSGQKDLLRHHKKAILMASCTEIYIDENHFADRYISWKYDFDHFGTSKPWKIGFL